MKFLNRRNAVVSHGKIQNFKKLLGVERLHFLNVLPDLVQIVELHQLHHIEPIFNKIGNLKIEKFSIRQSLRNLTICNKL